MYIFFALLVVLIGYVCIKLKCHHETPFKDTFFVSFYNKNISSKFNSLSKLIQHYRSRAATYVYTMCPSITKTNSYHSNIRDNTVSNGIYIRANVNADNDDDRLNLAEFQVYDETIMNDYLYQYQHNKNSNETDLEMTSKNPYMSLTMKT